MRTLAVCGGPGLGCSYLEPWLRPLGEFVFYNQPGCGMDTTPLERATLAATIAQFGELLQTMSRHGPIAVLTHSWGSHVVLSALKGDPALNRRIAALTLVNPMALTAARNRAALERLRARIPAALLARIAALFEEGSEASGAELMRLALPYYAGDPARPPEMSFHYRPPVHRRIMSALGEFDLTRTPLPQRVAVIRGACDYLLPGDTAELEAYGMVVEIQGAGHFPFAENPGAFAQALDSTAKADAL